MALERVRDLNLDKLAWDKSPDYQLAYEKGRGISACEEIRQYLTDQSRPFDVVVIKKGSTYGQMLTDSDKSGAEVRDARKDYKEGFGTAQDDSATMTIVRPTVFWCPDYTFEYYGDVKGCDELLGEIVPKAKPGPGDFYYKYKKETKVPGRTMTTYPVVPVVRYTVSTMAPWIVLYHELGHVKQYYEAGGELGWNAKLTNVAAIEADNLLRHENPICKQVTIAIRENYKHMPKGMEAVNQKYGTPALKEAIIKATDGLDRLRKEALLMFWTVRDSGKDEGYFYMADIPRGPRIDPVD